MATMERTRQYRGRALSAGIAPVRRPAGLISVADYWPAVRASIRSTVLTSAAQPTRQGRPATTYANSSRIGS